MKKHGLEQQEMVCVSGYGMNGNALECDRAEQTGSRDNMCDELLQTL